MDKPELSWDYYRSFLAVVEHSSLSAAARALGLTQPTVGRHIEALEQTLGVALFTRSPSGLAATEAALLLAPYAETLRATANALRRAVPHSRQDTAGVVRLSASEIVGSEVLPAILRTLRHAHPDIVLELVLSNRNQDLLRRDVDIAVRMVKPTQQALLAQRIGLLAVGLHAHESYLQRHGTPTELDQLREHHLIGYDQETPLIRALQAHGLPLKRSMFALRTDSDIAQLSAIRAGVGIGVCQVGLARRDPALRRVLAKALRLSLDTYVVMHEDLRHVGRYRIVFDALVAGLRDYHASQR
jgi:DNA-binding transcriptional LysR family regulator